MGDARTYEKIIEDINRAERRGDVLSDNEKGNRDDCEKALRRKAHFQARLESLGLLWNAWILLVGQRAVGFGPGAMRIEAADLLFGWLKIKRRKRIDLWERLVEMDMVYLRAVSAENKKGG